MKPAWGATWSLGLAGCCCFLAVCAAAQNEITKEPGLLSPSGTELPGPNCPWKKRSATLVPSFTKTTAPRTTTHHPTTKHHPTTTQHHMTTPNSTTTHHPTTQHHMTTPNSTTTHHPTTQHHMTTHNSTTTHHPTTQHHMTTPNSTTRHHPTSTQHHTTTHHPSTTHHPTRHPINHTTVPYTTHPHTPAPTPTQFPVVPIGNYRAGNESAPCVRLQAGLQIQVRYREQGQQQRQQLWGTFVVQPNHTEAFGNCSSQMASLDLRFPEGSLLFTFLKNDTSKTFYLSRVQAHLTFQFPQATATKFGADNSTLREFEAHLGHSYQCGNRSVALAPDFRLSALQEHVQAFELKAGQFGPAEFCQEPRRPAIVPIVVGVVLGLLIVIVVVAYAVGRWRTHQGYQTI